MLIEQTRSIFGCVDLDGRVNWGMRTKGASARGSAAQGGESEVDGMGEETREPGVSDRGYKMKMKRDASN